MWAHADGGRAFGIASCDCFNVLATLVLEIPYPLASCPRLSPRARSCSKADRSISRGLRHIRFSDAAVLWAAFYHVMFSADSTAMKHKVLKAKTQELANMFGVRLTFIDHDSGPKSYSLETIVPD